MPSKVGGRVRAGSHSSRPGALLVLVFCAATIVQADAQTWTADNGNGTYTNPLFFDEFSDPDLIRVGDDYYLTGTTMHSMPGLPILHSRDLVNWRFLTYALDRLDLGPEFRLRDGRSAYGQGIWAPCFRYHDGTFYIFSNVNGHTTQLLRATNPAGPWTRTPMRRSLHDISVLFDDDGKVYVVWGYRGIRLAELSEDLLDIVPGSEREIIPESAGMGEGVHFYKIDRRYFLTSAWFLGEMRMPTARADRLDGPWEVNQGVSRGEDFGFAEGYRFDPVTGQKGPPFKVRPGNPDDPGRNAIHQGGIVETPQGEWWGFSMMDANSVGRLTALSPVTWKDGWPYFGLPGNLGRTPRIWVKPQTGHRQSPAAPYKRSDDFSHEALQPVWQWNHVPVDSRWSLTERPGFLRLHALPATGLLDARNTLTQRSIGPRSTPTVVLDISGMKTGDRAGLALFNRPYAWLGVEMERDGPSLVLVTEGSDETPRLPVPASRIWLRAACDFLTEEARFSYSTDGESFRDIGAPFRMIFQLLTFQGVRYSLFSFNVDGTGGYADFDSIEVAEPSSRGLTPPIPYGEEIVFRSPGEAALVWQVRGDAILATDDATPTPFVVVERPLGRVALRAGEGLVSVGAAGRLALKTGPVTDAETFQWMETFTGDLILMSLSTHRYVRADPRTGALHADSPGPHPNRGDGVRWEFVRGDDFGADRTPNLHARHHLFGQLSQLACRVSVRDVEKERPVKKVGKRRLLPVLSSSPCRRADSRQGPRTGLGDHRDR